MLDIVIGFYEYYDDCFLGFKMVFEVIVYYCDDIESKWFKCFLLYLDGIVFNLFVLVLVCECFYMVKFILIMVVDVLYMVGGV